MEREFIEKSFTRESFEEFVKAFKERKEYEYYFYDNKKKYEVMVYCRKCENGMWKDNFMGSFGCSYGTSGFGYPIKVDEIEKLVYEELIQKICNLCEVKETDYQLRF